jgi:glycosyltransferase involved in cell wall biosynthesis
VRIFYFTRDHSPHDARFLAAIAKSGNEAFLLRLEGGDLEERGIDLPGGVTEIKWAGGTRPFRLWNTAVLRRSLMQVCSDIKPDVVHAGPLPDCAFITALSGIRPLVSMSWGFDLLMDVDRSRVVKWQAEYALSHSSVLIVDCQASANKAQELGFPSEKIVIFPWGVDLKHFSPGDGSAFREKLGWRDNFVILCNRSWEPRYGVDLVIRAFLIAHEKSPKLRLLLVGDGSQAGIFDEMISKASAEGFIHRPGRISLQGLPEYYRAADLYLSASHCDGSSVSLLEAMACGKPVVVSAIPANLEWVKDGENGWVFPDENAEILANELIHAEGSNKQLKLMAEKNRMIAETKANWEKNSRKLFQAYELAVRGER